MFTFPLNSCVLTIFTLSVNVLDMNGVSGNSIECLMRYKINVAVNHQNISLHL